MGIIILPFILGALGILIITIAWINNLSAANKINSKEILLGFLLSVTIYVFITILYIPEGEIWMLSPFLRIPIVAIFVPFTIYLLTKLSSNSKVNSLSTIILISICFSSAIGILYCNLFPGFLENFGVKGIY
jgi:hypothetical protein